MAKIKQVHQPPEKKHGFFYAIFVFIFLGLTGFVIYRFVDKVYQQNEIDLEVAKLEKEIETLNKENQNLNDAINYLQTEDFKEKEFKDKLNLIREGEELVLVKEKDSNIQEEAGVDESTSAELIVKKPNYYYWWHYFFSI